MTLPPDTVLRLVQARRNLRGTINTAQQALSALEDLLGSLGARCRVCLYERGLTDECKCAPK